jgi:hypothetical protein
MRKSCPRGEQKSMSAAVTTEIGLRIAHWMKLCWPVDTAKYAARAFGVELPTAEGWTKGKPPANRHWHAMVGAWGKGFLAFVYEPYHDWAHDLRFEAEIDAIKGEIARLEAQLQSRERPHVQKPDSAGDASARAPRTTQGGEVQGGFARVSQDVARSLGRRGLLATARALPSRSRAR